MSESLGEFVDRCCGKPDCPNGCERTDTRPCPHCGAVGFVDDPYCLTCGKTETE